MDIDTILASIKDEVANKRVPVVDLIAVQTQDPYKVLTATILSARTKDETTAAAAGRLFKKAPTISQLSELTVEEIEKLIYPVGFYKNKAKYLHKLPQSLQEFDNTVPDTIEELLTLPGVGRKTANLVRSVAFSKPAICVDTHVHRIMNIWQYVATSTPEQTEMALRKKLPQNHWMTVNSLLVAFGQSICKPVGPHCDICPIEKECPQFGVTPRKKSTSNTDKGVLQFISWNVNGIRALEKKGFVDIVLELSPDIFAIQETKAHADQLSDNLISIDGYHSFWHSAQKKGYSGVAVYSRIKPINIVEGIGNEAFDSEGRVLILEYQHFYFLNIYFPNSGAELKRLNYKLNFNRELHSVVEKLALNKPVVICGDYNVAHKEIDIKNPKSNVNNAGFTPDERSWLDHFLSSGWVDTFRLFNQDGGNYTWWSYRFNARAKNIGWRIDYFCVDESHQGRVKDAQILSHILGSDHCPILLEYKIPLS